MTVDSTTTAPSCDERRHDRLGVQRAGTRLELLAAQNVDVARRPREPLLAQREPNLRSTGRAAVVIENERVTSRPAGQRGASLVWVPFVRGCSDAARAHARRFQLVCSLFAAAAAQRADRKRRMADLRRRSRPHALRAARSDRREQLRLARGRVALQRREHGPDARDALPEHAARRRRRAVHDGRHAARRHGARRRDRRAALGLQLERRRARRGSAAQALGPRARVLAARRRQARRLRDAGLPARRVECGDGPAGRELRRRRHRRSQGVARSGRRLGPEADRHELAADDRGQRHHGAGRAHAARARRIRRRTSSATSAASTSSRASCSGRSTRCRGAASPATRRG